ncbi:MAG: GGDEF domain-containing protein [Gaiellales bacterium]
MSSQSPRLPKIARARTAAAVAAIAAAAAAGSLEARWAPARAGIAAVAVLATAAAGRALAVRQPDAVADSPPSDDQLETALAEMNQMNAELMFLRDQAEVHALTDQLTGVGNRRAFEEAVERALAAPYDDGHTVAVLMIDIDHFKAVNDTHGHARGDAVLCELAERLRAGAREHDVIARWGGEEFVVLLPGFPCDEATLARRAEVVREAVANTPACAGDLCVPLTVSVGAALRSARLNTPEQLVRAADAALYEAKRGGRNRVVLHRRDDLAAAA